MASSLTMLPTRIMSQLTLEMFIVGGSYLTLQWLLARNDARVRRGKIAVRLTMGTGAEFCRTPFRLEP